MPTLPPRLHVSREMLGIISARREKGRHHAPAAHTRRSPVMAGFTRMAGKGGPTRHHPQVLHALLPGLGWMWSRGSGCG